MNSESTAASTGPIRICLETMESEFSEERGEEDLRAEEEGRSCNIEKYFQ